MEMPEIIAEIISEPEKGFSEILLHPKPLFFSFLIVLVSLFCQSVAVLLLDNYSVAQAASLLSIGFFGKLFAFSVFWILITSLFHFIASWHKTEGNISNLFILFGASLLPLVFLPATAIITRGLGEGGHFLYLLIYMFIIIWIFSLQVKSLKVIYNLQTAKAVSVYVIPFISLFLLLVISTILLIVLTVMMISGTF